MEVEKGIRIDRLTSEYGPANQQEFLSAMEKIIKRLGPQHFIAAKEKLLAGDMPSTIDILLTYYDRTYSKGLQIREQQVAATIPWNGKDPAECALEMIQVADRLPNSQ